MSASEAIKTVSMLAGSDFTGDLFKVVHITADETVDLTSAVTDKAIGVIAGEGVAGAMVPIMVIGGGGRGKVKAGGTITAGQVLIPTAAGLVTGVAAASMIDNTLGIGVAIAGGDSGDVIPFMAQSMARSNDAA